MDQKNGLISLVRKCIFAMLLTFSALQACGQYSLYEAGFAAGGGISSWSNPGTGALFGPAFNANLFFSEYFCGKAYGFHISAGYNGHFPSTQNGSDITGDSLAGKTSLMITGPEVAGYIKFRAHDYHRPKEWAVLAGPKFSFPVIGRYNSVSGSGNLLKAADNYTPLMVAAHLSMLFRRPMGKLFMFIEPGAEYNFNPVFNTQSGYPVSPLYLFLNLDFTFWEQRG